MEERKENRTYDPAKLSQYNAQTESINRLYDAAGDAKTAGLRSKYDNSISDLKAYAEKLPENFRQARNMTAVESEREKHNFNEYAAARGLGSGAGSQAELARQNVLLGNLGAINNSEAEAMADVQKQMNDLKRQYEDAVLMAQAENAYQRAAAMQDELSKAEQSRVSVGQAQANENYRAYTAGAGKDSEEYQRNLQRAQTLAAYGDFSGYLTMGYTPEQVAEMERVYYIDHPKYAQASTAGGSAGTGSGAGYDNGGLTTEQVKEIQRALNSMGYKITVDGKYGAKTRAATGIRNAGDAYEAIILGAAKESKERNVNTSAQPHGSIAVVPDEELDVSLHY